MDVIRIQVVGAQPVMKIKKIMTKKIDRRMDVIHIQVVGAQPVMKIKK
jgi:hypothetical protein